MTPRKGGKDAESTNKRRRNRIKGVLPVRISGVGHRGDSYSELAHTLDLTETGVRLGAIRHPVEVGTLITLQYKRHKAAFRVVWSKPVAGHTEHQVGLEALNPKDLWGLGMAFREQPGTDLLEPSTAGA
jgi:hypothetical protein